MTKEKRGDSLKGIGKLMGQGTEKTRHQKGIIKRYFADKGYGFIEQQEGGDIFFHKTDVQKGTPKEGTPVEYFIGEGRQGRPAAKKLIVQEKNHESPSRPNQEPLESLYLPKDTKDIVDPAHCDNYSLSLNKLIEWRIKGSNSEKIEVFNEKTPKYRGLSGYGFTFEPVSCNFCQRRFPGNSHSGL